MPTTLRIALLAGLLALLSNLAVIGFIYERTHDEAVASLHRQVAEQSKVLTDVYRTGGKTALNEAIDDTLAYADPQTAVALISRGGGELKGNVATGPAVQSMQEGYHSAVIRLRGQPSPHVAEIVISRLAGGEWLVSGRLVGEGLAFRATLERSLILALAVAGLLGLLCGMILAHYVSRRIGQIAAVANRISARDLSQRVPLSGAGDSFDRLGLQINAMLDRISTLMEELRLLTDSLAHDLRSPVSRLRSAAHAAAQTSDPNEQEELLGSVVRNADALIRILTTVLEISRSEALTGRNQFAWFDVRELAAELAEMYDPLADERGAALRFDRPDRAVPLFGHRQLLAQALSNLLENAIRYGSKGGEIDVRVQPGEKRIRIEVADRGPGIPLNRREEAMKRFGRLDSSRSDEGAGLGLALAQSIAHLHDGELHLQDNRPGLLTSLEIPVHRQQAAR
ncbi:MAG TPA: HAMP domain-containing sensor histidine kinase [Sphingomicrobium sp.]|nr:HAMP domain-containing sensor histidine kinase [Sphingomicrobium sp.]